MKRSHLLVALGTLAGAADVWAAPLFSESFDSEAAAKVKVRKQADSAIEYVDYSSFGRQVPGAAAPTNGIAIPEAPGRLPGSLATRGVLLSSLYTSPLRSINLLAADAPGGSALSFTGNYRVTFDMWLNFDPAATVGTTEAGLWAVGTDGMVVVARNTRTTGVGTWGWLTTEGGNGTASGDAVLWVNNLAPVAPFVLENFTHPTVFKSAFPQSRPNAYVPSHQWTGVEVQVIGTRVVVKFNGVVFFDQPDGTGEGLAVLGYEDINNTSSSASPNLQFGLFDNFVVESIPDVPSLDVVPASPFAPAVVAGQAPTADFAVTNIGTGDLSILSAEIDGSDAVQFHLDTILPMIVPAGGGGGLTVTFTPAVPNGLKVARLLLTTDDPSAPVIAVWLQARREIAFIEGILTGPFATSVMTPGGTATGEITVTNSSTAPLTLSAATASGPNAAAFSVTTSLPVTIPVGNSAVLSVQFAPTGVHGLKTASIDIATSDAVTPTLSIPVKARYSVGPPLLAHYKMDDSSGSILADASGNNTLLGLQIREGPFGFSNPSLLPGGSGTSCRFIPADTDATGNFGISNVVHLPTVSYSLWIRPEGDSGSRTILHRSSFFSTTGTLHSLFLTEEGRLVFEVNSTRAVETDDGAIADNESYHVAVTHWDEDGFGNTTATRTRLFVNGVLVAERLAPEAPGYTDYQLNANAAGLYVATASGSGEGFLGALDDLQIYSFELTPGQVAGLFAQPGRTALELASSPFAITRIAANPSVGTVTLTWSSQAGATYAIWESSNLEQWSELSGHTGIVAADSSTTRTVTGIPPDPSTRFYRIEQTAGP